MQIKKSQRSTVVHVITGLNDGGAEGVLFRLCIHDTEFRHVVISLSGEGKYGILLRASGIEVFNLGMRPNVPSVLTLAKLVQLLRRYKPDVVQTWLIHGDLFGGLAARIAGIKALVWGIRHSTLEVGKAKITTIWISRLLAKLSSWLPARIIVCSERAIEVHEKLGFSRSKMRFVPNGFDLARFSSNQKDGNTIRAELGLGSDVLLIGTVARYDPQKDHSNLLGALSILHAKKIRIRCLLVGTNLDEDNLILVEQIRGFGLEDVVILAGRRTDVPAVMSALDLHILPSAYGEAFPNVVAEAMSCETPCVATDVGDSAYIIGQTGWVVPPCDAEALAAAIEKALKERLQSDQTRWRQRCFSAKKRIEQLFDIKKMITAYQKVWRESM